MKYLKNRQAGFSAFEGILVVVVFSLIAIGGFYVYQRASDTESDNNQAYTETMTEQVPEITSSDDLGQAEAQLEAINIDDLDTSELEAIEDELL